MNMKEQFERARNLSVSDTIIRMGGKESRGSKENHKSREFYYNGSKVVVTGQKFFIPKGDRAGNKGGGAVDVIIALGLAGTPKDALRMLLGSSDLAAEAATSFFHSSGIAFPPEAAAPKAVAPKAVAPKAVAPKAVADKPLSVPPEPASENWLTVRNWLTQTENYPNSCANPPRGLDCALVDSLHEQGKIFADADANAVFLANSGEAAELKGTRRREKWGGKRGSGSFFELAPLPGSNVDAMFVEAAIDALSVRQLGFRGRVISTGGGPSNQSIKLAQLLHSLGINIIAGFDNDDVGRNHTKRLQSGVICEVRRPRMKDWNEDLLAALRSLERFN